MDFNKAAAIWDDETRINRAKIIADEIKRAVRPYIYSNALEFGCGTGLISFNLADFFAHITLVDNSPGMIEELNRKIKNAGVTNMIALCADIAHTDIEIPDRYDVIFSSMAIHHVEDLRRTLSRLIEMLVPGGCMCIVDLVEDDGSFHRLEPDFKGHNGFNPDDFGKLLEILGLRDVAHRVFYSSSKLLGDSTVQYSLFLIKGRKP
jgi:SAM-dependent methyltransferase